MGKFEKIVVLAVLFLVTLILVVSLNTDEKDDLLHAALGGVEEITLGDPVEATLVSSRAEWKAEDIDGLESAAFDLASAPLSGRVEKETLILPAFVFPEGSILCEWEGLVETRDPALFLHTVSEGETYESLALWYYGDISFSEVLRLANDDLQDVPMVETVIIPAFDQRLKLDDRLSGRTFIVKTGDTFTGISRDHL